ncbi:hypothetical protein F5B20DRAFT_574611 [Whalleya microplaca]|nr:hypothetical protein F5B20DRAFT_574611 [Whalleya microplaca]
MADTVNPQTPPRKLFKPSSKTKTPTPVKRLGSTTPTPSSDTPIGLIDNDVFTPTDTVSRSTDAVGALSRNASETKKAVESSSKDEARITGEDSKTPTEATSGQSASSTQSLTEKPDEALDSSTDISKYFAEQGIPEMSSFIETLTGKISEDPTTNAGDAIGPIREASQNPIEPASRAKDSSRNDISGALEELPTNDNLIISPNERTKQAVDNTTDDTMRKASDTTNKIEGSKSKTKDSESKDKSEVGHSFTNQTPDLSDSVDVSKMARGIGSDTEKQLPQRAPSNTTGELNTLNSSKSAQANMSNMKDKANGATQGSPGRKTTNVTKEAPSDDTRVVDNMGEPAHIERRIEIPLPRPEKVASSPSKLNDSNADSNGGGLGDTENLPTTQNLPSTDNLPEVPDDPPEEVLDPSIPKITPVGIAPPDLLHLAQGLGGHTVDDVGNIVDVSGKVLGHATGDLPAMVGKKVAENGEIYGDDQEVIGYVSENFTGPPPPTQIPDNVLGGLKVDHEGNILDSSGSIIGRFNQKPGENNGLPPFMQSAQNSEPKAEEQSREEKPLKVNAQNGGSPSDIFLDVKSTNDGIQLTIRIPTTFSRPAQD